MKTILTLALLLVIPAAAAAQTAGDTPLAPALKQNVIVTNDLVRIGDLVENAGASAQIAIFRAPDLGSTGTVAVARIVEAVRAHDVFAINTRGLNEITVTRASRSIVNKDIEERIASAIASQFRMGEAKNIGITFDRDVSSIQAEPGNNADLRCTRLSFDPRSGRFDATLDLPGSNAVRRGSLRFTGIAAEVVDAAVLTRSVARGEVLRTNDIVIERKPKRELAGRECLRLEPRGRHGCACAPARRPDPAPRRPDETRTRRRATSKSRSSSRRRASRSPCAARRRSQAPKAT